MNRLEKTFGVIAAISGFLAVALGAFGAHVLRQKIDPGYFSAFEVATHYQLAHSIALLLTVLSFRISDRLAKVAAWAFLVGIVLFSGSLYVLVLTQERMFGVITPLGGVAFLVGWLTLGIAIWRR